MVVVQALIKNKLRRVVLRLRGGGGVGRFGKTRVLMKNSYYMRLTSWVLCGDLQLALN